MRENFSLDRLIDYETEPVQGNTKIVNPNYRKLDSEIKKNNSLLSKRKAKFGSILLEGEIEEENVEKYAEEKGALLGEIQSLEAKVKLLKEARKKEKKHITVDDLPEEDQFEQLSQSGKHLIDTIKMIAYRSETAMSNILMSIVPDFDKNATRALLREIYNNTVDLVVDKTNKTLRVRMHHLATRGHDNALQKLCAELTATETEFPESGLKMIYELIE
jgi:acetolactate synthase small subunit